MGFIGKDSELKALDLAPLDLKKAPEPEPAVSALCAPEPVSAPAPSVLEPALPV